MDDSAALFSPAEAESYTGYSPDFMRELRRRKIGVKFGLRQPNGHFAYSIRDIVGLTIARELAKLGFQQDRAFEIGHGAATTVIDYYLDPDAGAKHGCVPFSLDKVVLWPALGKEETARLISEHDDPVCLFPIRSLANLLPENVRSLILPADE